MVTVGVTTWFYISIYPIALAFTFSNSAKDNFKSFCCSFVAVLPQFEGFNCIAKILHCKIELGVSIAINK